MCKSIISDGTCDSWRDPLCDRSPLSRSESGDDAPLHWLRGPSTGDRRPRSERETLIGRSRLLGRHRGGGEEEDEQEEELEKGQGDSSSPCGLLREEPRLQGEWHSSSSVISRRFPPPPPGASSSKQSDTTVRRTRKRRRGPADKNGGGEEQGGREKKTTVTALLYPNLNHCT